MSKGYYQCMFNQYQYPKNKESTSQMSIQITSKQISNNTSSQITQEQSEQNNQKSYIIPLYLFFCFVIIITFFSVLNTNKETQIYVIAIVGTNDIHGSAFPKKFVNPLTKQAYLYGGLIYMANIIQILIAQFGNGKRLLYFDAGDSYQGSLQSSTKISSGQTISDYFNHVNLDAGAIGNHQFDEGLQFLSEYINKIHAVQLSANLVSTNSTQGSQNQTLSSLKRQTSKLFSLELPNQIKAKYQLNELKIGVIGLSTLQTTITSPLFSMKNPEYKLLFYKDIVVRQSQKLKQKGANAILILSHVGNQCNDQLQYKLRTQKEQSVIPCRKNDEIFQLIDNIPKNTIHGVIQGHRLRIIMSIRINLTLKSYYSFFRNQYYYQKQFIKFKAFRRHLIYQFYHNTAHYFYKGIPFIGAKSGGYYLNVIYFPFLFSFKEIKLQVNQIMIEGPVPICEKIYSNIKNCEYLDQKTAQTAGVLQNWKFHSKPIAADKQLQNLYSQKYGEKIKQYEKVIFENFISFPIKTESLPYQPLGNLMTNLISKKFKQVDFIIMNTGQFRSIWYPGSITYMDFLSMIPYKTNLIKFKIKGSNIKSVFTTCQQGYKGLYTTWGVKQYLQSFVEDNKLKYKFIKIQFQAGSQIQNDKIYTGITTVYLMNGGDDFFFIKQKSQIFMNSEQVGVVSEIIMEEVTKFTIDDQFIDIHDKNPRIIIRSQSK